MRVRVMHYGEVPKVEGEIAPPSRATRILELVVVSVAASIITQIVMAQFFPRRRSR